MSKLISGTTMECLKHYAEWLTQKPDKARIAARAPLINFTSSSPHTVQRWLTGKQPPVGEKLLKVRYFLQAVGYHVAEYDNLSEPVKKAVELVALGIISVNKLSRKLGYAEEDHLMGVLRGSENISSSKVIHVNKIHLQSVTIIAEKLLETMKSWPVNICTDQIAVLEFKKAETNSLATLPQKASERELLLHSLAGIFATVLPLAEKVASDSFTPEERQNLRKLAGEYTIFNLSNALHKLCGERARRSILEKGYQLPKDQTPNEEEEGHGNKR